MDNRLEIAARVDFMAHPLYLLMQRYVQEQVDMLKVDISASHDANFVLSCVKKIEGLEWPHNYLLGELDSLKQSQ